MPCYFSDSENKHAGILGYTGTLHYIKQHTQRDKHKIINGNKEQKFGVLVKQQHQSNVGVQKYCEFTLSASFSHSTKAKSLPIVQILHVIQLPTHPGPFSTSLFAV